VDLGHELRDFIEYLIESGDYRTQSEVIRESLRLLREKQAESRLQTLRNLLAEGLSSGEPVVWEKDTFLKKLKQAQSLPVKNVKLTPKASQDLEDIWYYGYHHFR
jgi:antitoxin ParD1/3/4